MLLFLMMIITDNNNYEVLTSSNIILTVMITSQTKITKSEFLRLTAIAETGSEHPLGQGNSKKSDLKIRI